MACLELNMFVNVLKINQNNLVAKHFTFYECIKFSEQNLCLTKKLLITFYNENEIDILFSI